MKTLVSLIKRVWNEKIIRFLVVGTFNTFLDFALFNIFLLVFKLPTPVATTLSVSIGITSSYFLNHRIVFRHHDNPSLKKYLHFFVVTGFSVIIIQNVMIWLVTHIIKVEPGQLVTIANHSISAETLEVNAAKLVGVLFGMVWNFMMYKYVIFRGQSPEEAEEELSIA